MADAVKPALLAEVKNVLNISVATFDTDINTDLDFAVKDLYPIAVQDIAVATVTLLSDYRSFTIPTGTSIVRRVEVDGYSVDFIVHGTKVFFTQGPVDSGSEVTCFGQGRWGFADYTDIPLELHTVLIYWAVAKFYTALAGNKRKYNIYVGTVGSAADRDMKDSADYFKELGDQYLEERTGIRGF
jgi:hypothetical protein